jgi:hypothetical protein
VDTGGEETAAAIHAEIARDIDQWLRVPFNGRRKTGRVDLEAGKTAIRSANSTLEAARSASGSDRAVPGPRQDRRSPAPGRPLVTDLLMMLRKRVRLIW